MNYITLESVGTVIDTESGMTYAVDEDGAPDMYTGVHIDDITSNDWFERLSYEDEQIVNNVMGV